MTLSTKIIALLISILICYAVNYLTTSVMMLTIALMTLFLTTYLVVSDGRGK